MIVAIDGPAGAGKSSIARRIAKELGFEFLDTGAMYRAVTLAAIRSQIDLKDVEGLVGLVQNVSLHWTGETIFLGEEDVSVEIRTPTVTDAIRYLADEPRIRSQLSAQQRRIAAGRNIVTEGRDQGAEVFPEAECKIFLTASPEQRAIRRHQQLISQGRHMEIKDVLAAQNKRDLEDQSRPVGRLRAADDAIIIDTDEMTADEVVQQILKYIRSL